ncbi:ABC transporter [Streptomyces sp. Ru62]|uniref:ATP-binding cassette domain-containing protein n=1 Tax=Streptomyces sp. Ru62 TaxID=2080745 RepID=UPI000CDE482D|nr:ATP-binding cassette domain-containing protein [Streptomyces sp. Ru62]POX59770.1 ABC transporter [Streptomyces sp. Ru62]
MIQAFGLTSNPRKAHPPAVDDVSFEAPAGHVTALLGAAGAGKTTALKLMLELEPGRGITYFRGRPLHRIAHPSREVGVLLGDVPGHPSRSVRGHLRMLCAASGVPARRADEVLEVVGLVSLREERLGTLSRGMDRRLGLACALLPDPHTLVLDEPADGLSAREAQWLHSMLRAHAVQGGTVLFTTADTKEAARTADRVVTLDAGRVVADQEARVFARTRLRPRVAVRSPHAVRLAALLTKDARTARRSVEVVREGGNRLSVYGTTTADVGEIAFRHGILVHQLADEVGDMGPGAGTERDAGVSSTEPLPVVPDASPADRETRQHHSPAESEASASHGPYEEPQQASAAPSWARRRRTVSGRSAPEPATGSAPNPGSTALRDSPENPSETVDESPTAPADARPVSEETETLALHAADARATEPPVESRAPGTGATAAESRATPPDRSASEPDTTAPWRSSVGMTITGQPSGQREHAPDSSAPEPERAVGGPSPVGEDRLAPGLAARERVWTADGERTAPSHGLDQRSVAERPLTVSGATAHDAPSAGAAEDGTHGHGGVTASGEKNTAGADAGDAPARATGGRSTDPATTPDSGLGGVATASEPQAGRARTATAIVAGARTLLPGARNPAARQQQTGRAARPDGVRTFPAAFPLPPPITVRPARSPLRPLRYEIRRAGGIGTGFLTCGAVLVVSVLTAVLLARLGHTPQARLFAAWPRELPLPPAALAAGLLGALAFGDEFRHPALAADRGTVPRRLGLLTAKLLVSGATAVLLAFLTVGCDAEVLYIVYGRELTQVPADWLSLTASWFGLVVGCAWAGVLAAGVFRSTTAGLAAVLAVPVLVVPLVDKALRGPAVRMAPDFPVRMREVFLLQWPFGGERYLVAAVRVLAQPVGGALALSLAALLCAYLLTALRTRFR